MMKLKTIKLIGFSLLLTSLLLQACMDEESKNYSQLTIGTVQVIEGNDYYFQLDPGSKMHPGDTTHIQNYPLKQGQRAFVYFDLLDEKIAGYDYNAIIYRIENILTKDVLKMPSEITEESAGNDRINITNLWVANNYLNIQYQFYYDDRSEKQHLLNLLVNENDNQKPSTDDYLTLEFRHNGYNENKNRLGPGLVSFRLDKISDLMKNKKGLIIRYHSLYDGTKSQTIDF